MTDIQPLEIELVYDPNDDYDARRTIAAVNEILDKLNAVVDELNRLNEKVGRYGMGG